MSRQGPARGRYVFENQGVPTDRGLHGMHILKESAGCQVWKPVWGGKRTIIRPLPVLDPDNPTQWDPFRLSDAPHGFGDWIRRYDIAFSIGTPGITFITRDPRDNDLDAQQNPVWMLHRTIPAAVRSGQAPSSWGRLVVGQQNRPNVISPPKDGYVMQGILVEWGDRPRVPPVGLQASDKPVVFLMSQSAGEALLEALQRKNSDGSWLYPDLTRLDGGAFIQFHQAGTQQARPVPQQQAQSLSTMQRPLGGGQQKEEKRYEVEILSNYNGTLPVLTDLEPMLKERARRTMWDDILHVPTIEEQVRRLSNCGLPASAVVYALGEAYGDMIPEDVIAAARDEHTQSSVPFQGFAPGLPQQGGQPATLAETQQPMQADPSAAAPAPAVVQPQQPLSQTLGAFGQAAATPTAPLQQSAPQALGALGQAAATPTAPLQQQAPQALGALGQAATTPPLPAAAVPPPGPPMQQPGTPAATPAAAVDSQPTHASPDRQASTMAAIEAARLEAQAAKQQQQARAAGQAIS